MRVSEIKNILKELQVSPLKSLGQNFLIDESLIQKICTYKNLNEYKRVVEIGPGLGSLTNNFSSFKEKVLLIELDKSLYKYWVDRGFDVHHQDALKFDWKGVEENAILISNLPYQISSRLLIELFCVDTSFDEMILMFQKEVGDRIQAIPEDKKEYGLLSIICQLGWKVRTVTKVSNKCFYPAPQVESVVLFFSKKLIKRIDNRKAFVNHLKLLFGARRKKMNNTFKKYQLEWPVDLKHYLDMRPDQINAEEHLKLYQFVGDKNV